MPYYIFWREGQEACRKMAFAKNHFLDHVSFHVMVCVKWGKAEKGMLLWGVGSLVRIKGVKWCLSNKQKNKKRFM